MQKITVPIRGMHCKSCEILIEEKLKEVRSIRRAEASHAAGRAKIWYENEKPPMSGIGGAVEAAGYQLGQEDKKHWFSRNPRDYYMLMNAAVMLALLFILARLLGAGNISYALGRQSIAMSLAVGLVAGISSCMALIGGLVLALSARHAELHPEATRLQKFRPHVFFNLGRVLGFALFGGAIGLIGGALQPSIRSMAILTILVGGAMILLGLKLIDIFPVLQRINITLPKSVSRLLGAKTEEKEYSHAGALIGGAMTFFLPCGFTQAMQLYAISTGSFMRGALIMSLFALGTAPGLLGIGGLSSAFKGSKARLFFAAAGLAVIALGIYNINNARRIAFPANDSLAAPAGQAANESAQTVTAAYRSGSDISPKDFTVKAGQPVRFLVDAKDQGSGCMSTIMIPGLYNKPLLLEKGRQLSMEFTPSKAGRYPITCAMGIQRGTLIVE